MTAMSPCHTGHGVRPATPRVDPCLLALPANGRLVLASAVHPAGAPELPIALHSAFLETSTPPPRLG